MMTHIRGLTRIVASCLVPLHLAAASSQAVVIGKVYWSSNKTDTISRCNLDGTHVETVVSSLVNPSGPALAPGQQKMYWMEQSPLVIRRANLDGTAIETIMTGLVANPFGIAVDEPHNRLFWTSDSGGVYRANLDGTGRTVLRTTANRVLDIAYDPVGDKIYWAESFDSGVGGTTPHIWRSNPDGTGVQDLVLSGLSNPFSLALDVGARKMYWGDRGLHTISRANLDGTAIQTVASGLTDPSAIAVDSTSGSLYYANGSAIMRASLDGTNPVVFVPNQSLVFGLGVIPLPEPASLLLLALPGLALTRRRVRHHARTIIAVVAAALLLSATSARAVNMEMVIVGNPGNAPDTRYATPGYGAVSYAYQIGKYEVTAGQYCEFLNAVAKTDTYGLYNPGCSIQRSGSPGSYTYSVAPDWANRPVNYVSWGDGVRFANWLANGQPTGSQGPDTTERGSYRLDGATTDDQLSAVTRNANASYVITTASEWYKAAYHKNDGATGNYWKYPTRSDSPPSNALVNPDPGNSANYYQHGYTVGPPYYRTEVGEFENSASAYGTFDQGGNVWEWNETVFTISCRGLRGGAFRYNAYLNSVGSDACAVGVPTAEEYDTGFRLAYVPEPATVLLLALGGLAVNRSRQA